MYAIVITSDDCMKQIKVKRKNVSNKEKEEDFKKKCFIRRIWNFIRCLCFSFVSSDITLPGNLDATNDIEKSVLQRTPR